MENKTQNPNYIELGVLWRKTGAKGDFYSGIINLKNAGYDKDVPCIVFVNKTKRSGKIDPDLRIYLSQPRDGASAPAAKSTPAPATKPAARPISRAEETEAFNIPEDNRDVL